MDFEQFKKEIFKIIYNEKLYEYLIKYHDSLEKIKILLEKSADSLERFEKKLNDLKTQIEKNIFKPELPDFLIDKITSALYLRYVIEIVISLFVSNNKNNLKNNKKINTGRVIKVIDILYEEENIDIGIFKGEVNDNSITLYMHNFWTREELIKNYNFLSQQIHRFHELNENWTSSKYSSHLNLIDNNYEANYKIFQELKNIGIIIYNTLYNHMISIENDKVIIEIKNMKIFTFYPDKLLKFSKK